MLMKSEPLDLTLDNSISEQRRGDHQNKIKTVQEKERSSNQMWILCRREQWEYLITEMFSDLIWTSSF